MRIGIVTYHFPPEPAFIPGSLAEELAARGHEVRVLTGFPDYPGGHVYPGWRQRWHHETRSRGLTVRRVPRYSTGDVTVRGRMASWLTFAGSAALVGGASWPEWTCCTCISRRPPRSPRRRCSACSARCRWCCTCRTSGPNSSPTPSTTAGGRRGSGGHAPDRDAVLADGIDPARIRVVLNWTDERVFRPVPASPAARRLVRRDERCVVMHAGTIGAAALGDTVDLVLVGSGAEERRVRGLAAELRADNVRFVDRRSPLDMPELYAAADYQLVMVRDLPELRGSVPAKLQAVLSCGAPVVVSAGGDTAALVERARAGLSCPPEDWASLADRFWLAAQIPVPARVEMGRRGREAYLREMSLPSGVDRIEELLREAAAGDTGHDTRAERISRNA